MERGKIAFQSKDYKFNKRVWAFWVWVRMENGGLSGIFGRAAMFSKSGLMQHAREYIKRMREDSSSEVLDYIVVLSLKFSKLYPLKSEYWQGSDFVFDESDRSISLLKAAEYKDLYQVVITPSFRLRGGKVGYAAAFAFKKECWEEAEALMRASDLCVIPEAKNVGVYDVWDVYGYNLVENKRVKQKDVGLWKLD